MRDSVEKDLESELGCLAMVFVVVAIGTVVGLIVLAALAIRGLTA